VTCAQIKPFLVTGLPPQVAVRRLLFAICHFGRQIIIPPQIMFKYTKYLLEKIEALFAELGYEVRYERGSFQSGYCVVHQQRIAVINKFFDTEARINTLLEIIDALSIDPAALSEESQHTYSKIRSVLKAQNVSTE
jgi:hypothetical protein